MLLQFEESVNTHEFHAETEYIQERVTGKITKNLSQMSRPESPHLLSRYNVELIFLVRMAFFM